eukprot:Phypoly_transcript_05803.p1 GENE.Phypoly_transcript_05803~~Phypoly_transcript_05803.p1  ORF type:complete len:616 (+),score=85.44 Phypoly_transcript_05803:46-1893(+)
MANSIEVLKRHLASLQLPQATNKEKVAMLQQVRVTLLSLSDAESNEVLPTSNLVLILANSLNENKQWSTDCPTWINALVRYIYRDAQVKIPGDQTNALADACREYLAINENWQVVKILSHLASSVEGKLLLLKDSVLCNLIKRTMFSREKDVADAAMSFFAEATNRCDEWQLKLIEDKLFILDIMSLHKSSWFWRFIRNLAQHPDAKTKLPGEVLTQANTGVDPLCVDISALLCNENDTKVNSAWIDDRATRLELLILGKSQGEVQFHLLDLILPFANLSVIDSKKDILGKRTIGSFLKVVADEVPKLPEIQEYLPRAKQEAAKAIWNFAFLESNRTIILNALGIGKLENSLKQTNDPILKKNIMGILNMFSAERNIIYNRYTSKGHIMISYNFEDQPTVIRIRKSLKENGSIIWVDFEQTETNLTETMAAIEQADLVLVCMSQKYKDTPCCRWEAEYCMSRKVPFIPVLLQSGYKPDGWLGLAVGNKMSYDFSDESDWDTKAVALVKGFENRGKGAKQSIPPPSTAIQESIPTNTKSKDTKEWTLEDVHEWMKAERIEHHFELFKQHKFDGRALLELKRLLSPQQPAFFAFICEQLKITELGEMLRLSSAINSL